MRYEMFSVNGNICGAVGLGREAAHLLGLGVCQKVTEKQSHFH